MKKNTQRLDAISAIIRQKNVVAFDTILNGITCSAITLRRDLKTIRAITSYTHRGHFVTLPDIPRFNDYGIWFYRNIGFSKVGNSLNTILSLVEQGKDGFYREELEAILKIGISKQIQMLVQADKISRVKFGSKYLYLPEAAMKNKKKRLRLIGERQVEERFEKGVGKSDLIALLKAVLIEKRVGLSLENIKRIAQKYALRIPLKGIQQLLLKHDLPEKKSPDASKRAKSAPPKR